MRSWRWIVESCFNAVLLAQAEPSPEAVAVAVLVGMFAAWIATSGFERWIE